MACHTVTRQSLHDAHTRPDLGDLVQAVHEYDKTLSHGKRLFGGLMVWYGTKATKAADANGGNCAL
jgi:hypothetical protein